MTGEQDAGPGPAHVAAEGVRLEARVVGDARVYQAGRDLHIRHGSYVPAARRVAGSDAATECPYPGLAAFGPEDARWFFGRDAVLAELTSLLSAQSLSQGPVVLVASSGAGKSSLLRAGLLPALRRGALPRDGSQDWPHLAFTPTAHPLAALADQLSAVIGISPERLSAALAGNPACLPDLIKDAVSASRLPGGGVAVVADQFEETFTLCDNEAEQRVFVEALCALGSAVDLAAGLVVLGLRADFYLHACAYPMLRMALRDRQILMGPMSQAELRQAIEYPGQAVGLELEPGLVELLIRDLGGTLATGSWPGSTYGHAVEPSDTGPPQEAGRPADRRARRLDSGRVQPGRPNPGRSR
jgi:hypothetical protein